MLLAALAFSGAMTTGAAPLRAGVPERLVATQRMLPSRPLTSRLAPQTDSSPRAQYCRATMRLGMDGARSYTVVYPVAGQRYGDRFGCTAGSVPLGLAGFLYLVAPIGGAPNP